MASLKLLLGLIPSTSKIEQAEKALITEFEKLKTLSESDKLARYNELNEKVNSAGFFQKKKEIEYLKYKNSTEFDKEKEYQKLQKTKNIHDDSQRLKRYNELKEYIVSEEFKKRKNYLLDKKRFERTEMFKELREYNMLKKDKEIIWYFKTKDSNKYDILKTRELTFSDEFDGDKLDTSKWIPNYYWGEKLLHDRYSVEHDLQAYTEKENFEIRNSVLKIITRRQKTIGKVWINDKGFAMKELDYTSGIICSGANFRQKYGIFQAKIKLGNTNAKSAFWMLADKITPHIDVCKTSNGKIWFDLFPLKGDGVKTSLKSKYASDFYIFTLEWTVDKLIWKINNTEVFTQTSNIPQDPMYILLSGGLDKPINETTSMEIDWIRVYQPKK